MNPTVLLINIDILQQSSVISVLNQNNISYIPVSCSLANSKIADIIAGNLKSNGNAFLKPAVILFGFIPNSMDNLLAQFKAKGLLSNVPKAIVTPYNISWTVKSLVDKIYKEHQEMSK